MRKENQIKDYRISDIIHYRSLPELQTDDFLFLTKIPSLFEPFSINPNYYSYGLITKGVLKIEIDNQLCDLSPNSLMIYRPNEIFKIIEIAPETEGVFVLFTKDFVNTLSENIFTMKSKSFLSYGVNVCFELSSKDKESLLKAFNTIFSLLEVPTDSLWESMARNLTSALIYQTDNVLKNYIDNEKILVSKDEIIFRQFKNLAMKYYTKERELNFYAFQLNMSVNNLSSIIKRASGKSPGKLINTLVLNESKRLLKTTNDTVGMIADYLNYCDIYTFSKYFKRNTGYSPSQFRTA